MALHSDVDAEVTTDQAAAVAGLTHRQLDHWVRESVIAPRVEATGSGSARRWDSSQLPVLRLLATLRDLGASLDTLREVSHQASEFTSAAWGARVLITPEGRIATLLGADANGYLVDLSLLRSVAEEAERALLAA